VEELEGRRHKFVSASIYGDFRGGASKTQPSMRRRGESREESIREEDFPSDGNLFQFQKEVLGPNSAVPISTTSPP